MFSYCKYGSPTKKGNVGRLAGTTPPPSPPFLARRTPPSNSNRHNVPAHVCECEREGAGIFFSLSVFIFHRRKKYERETRRRFAIQRTHAHFSYLALFPHKTAEPPSPPLLLPPSSSSHVPPPSPHLLISPDDRIGSLLCRRYSAHVGLASLSFLFFPGRGERTPDFSHTPSPSGVQASEGKNPTGCYCCTGKE